MKAVLISINPKWCEPIASGKKTVEVRKTRPKIETPFKVYIYCTQGKPLMKTPKSCFIDEGYKQGENLYGLYHLMNGKVIGEFVCDKIEQGHILWVKEQPEYYDQVEEKTQLTYREMFKYLGQCGVGFFWHISNLVIYDDLKELSELKTPEWFRDCQKSCNYIEYMRCPIKDSRKAQICGWCRGGGNPITRPPQSWCYVDEVYDGRYNKSK